MSWFSVESPSCANTGVRADAAGTTTVADVATEAVETDVFGASANCGAGYGGVAKHAARNSANAGRILRIGNTFIPNRERRAQGSWTKRMNVVGDGNRLRATGRDAANEDVEQRREEQAEERHAEHAGEHGNAHHVSHLGTRATGDHERHDTHDERARTHEA